MPIEPEAFLTHRPAEFKLSGIEAGRLFASAPADVQAQFLRGLSEEVASWYGAKSWPIQCRFIADEFAPEHAPAAVKARMVRDLETLMEHLTEPKV